jgi:SAM-dependent methyltransferase
MRTVQPVCRSCGEARLTPILALGEMPLANRLLTDEQLRMQEPSYPLNLVLCPSCALVQITETVPPEELVRDYVDFSPYSDDAARHARPSTAQIIASQNLRPTSLVVEIAGHDGSRLQDYQQADIPVLRIEAAENVAEAARGRHGVPTLRHGFGKELAVQLEGCSQLADVVYVNDVLAHAPDLNGLVEGLRIVLKTSGVAVIEVPYVKDLIDRVEFDAIYHEHLCYFSLTALARLFARHGLIVHDVERIAVHGGSLRLFVGRTGGASERVEDLLAEEKGWGVDRAAFYLGFGQRVERLRHELMALLRRLKSEGRRIAVYGASARGSTLLNYFKIGREMVDFVVDRNTLKQGRYTPGTRLKIHSPKKLVEDKPDYVLLLSRNFADEILVQQADYRQRGGRFIIPIPSVKVA